MSALLTLRNALIATAVALLVALGIETEWGAAFTAPPLQSRSGTVKQDATSVLPDFRLGSEASAYSQIVERPLLNPSRKPAPTQLVTAAPEPPKPQIRRGIYLLAGISDLGTVKIAQLRELGTARLKSVKVGDSLQEMRVAKIEADSVTLEFMGETDVMTLPKFTASGRVPTFAASATPQLAAQSAANPGGPPATDSFPSAPAVPGAPAAPTVMGIPITAPPQQQVTGNTPRPVFPGAGENSPIPGRVSVGELLEARRRMRESR